MPTMTDIISYREGKEETTTKEETPTEVTEKEEVVEEESEAHLGEDEPSAPVEEPEGEALAYFNELPDTMGWDAEQFYNLKLKTDTGKEYTWSEIKDSMQTLEKQEADIKQRAERLKSEEVNFNQQLQQANQILKPATNEIKQAQTAIQTIEYAYQNELTNLENYRNSGSTEGMVASQAELTRLQGLYGQAQASLKNATGQYQQQQQQQQQQYKQSQLQKIREMHPEFTSSEQIREVVPKVKEFLASKGQLLPNEINNLVDARVLSLFYKAYLYDKHQGDVRATTEKVKGKTIQRLVKGQHGAPATSRDAKNKAVSRAKTSRRESDMKLARRAIAKSAGLLE